MISISNVILESIDDKMSAEELFNLYSEMQGRIEDFADKWNNFKGYPEEVNRQRTKLINPVVVDFVNDYYEDIKDNWEELSDIMHENNYHIAADTIEKEMKKYE